MSIEGGRADKEVGWEVQRVRKDKRLEEYKNKLKHEMEAKKCPNLKDRGCTENERWQDEESQRIEKGQRKEENMRMEGRQKQ
jgi:hypothetical protein